VAIFCWCFEDDDDDDNDVVVDDDDDDNDDDGCVKPSFSIARTEFWTYKQRIPLISRKFLGPYGRNRKLTAQSDKL